MFISEVFRSKQGPVFSFEIFPPKREYPIETIYNTIEELVTLNPDFVSVTYGAAGGTKDRTVEIAGFIKNKWGKPPLAHLTCMGASEEAVLKILDDLASLGVKNILALRGDPPKEGPIHEGAFKYARDLVRFTKEEKPGAFCIGGAAYPEGHVEAPSMACDLLNLKKKVDEGVSFLITQLFFDNELFLSFRDVARSLGINIPITAGIMPVLNAKQISRMVSLCGASIPTALAHLIARYERDPEGLYEAGIEYAIKQIKGLIKEGADGIHLYTMNKPEVARRIMAEL